MKPEAQRIAMAELCGWIIDPEDTRAWPSFGQWCIRPGGARPISKHNIPDYLNDLNACHSAALALREQNPKLYMRYQQNLIKWDGMYYTDAPAAQRTEAMLRATGRWVE